MIESALCREMEMDLVKCAGRVRGEGLTQGRGRVISVKRGRAVAKNGCAGDYIRFLFLLARLSFAPPR